MQNNADHQRFSDARQPAINPQPASNLPPLAPLAMGSCSYIREAGDLLLKRSPDRDPILYVDGQTMGPMELNELQFHLGHLYLPVGDAEYAFPLSGISRFAIDGSFAFECEGRLVELKPA